MKKLILSILILLFCSCGKEEIPVPDQNRVETIRIDTSDSLKYEVAVLKRGQIEWLEFQNTDGDYRVEIINSEDDSHKVEIMTMESISAVYTDVDGEILSRTEQTYNNVFSIDVSQGSIVKFQIIYR